jgi:hypothetical protein
MRGSDKLSMAKPEKPHQTSEHQTWRDRWYEIIFEADTPGGKLFDVVLLLAIVLSVIVVMCESVASIRSKYPMLLYGAEWFFTLLFTVEYFVRIICIRRPSRYIFSFYGLVDVLAILPTYIGALPFVQQGTGTQRLAVIRALRLLRAFRIFKLANMLSEAHALRQAIWSSRAKVAVFLSFVTIAVVIVGSAMHLIEGGKFDGSGKADRHRFRFRARKHVLGRRHDDDRRLRGRLAQYGGGKGPGRMHDDPGILPDHRAHRHRHGRIGSRWQGQETDYAGLSRVPEGRPRQRRRALQILRHPPVIPGPFFSNRPAYPGACPALSRHPPIRLPAISRPARRRSLGGR